MNKRYAVNDNFFSEDNEKSLYWAGFLAADGNLSNNGGEIVKLLRLTLSNKDIKHIKQFKKDLTSKSPIKIRKAKLNNKIYQHASIGITSEKLASDLISRFDLTPNKTFTYKFPKRLINHPLVHHFIRGYFDGDGCVGKYSNQIRLELVGTFNLIKHIKYVLHKNLGLESKASINKRKKYL